MALMRYLVGGLGLIAMAVIGSSCGTTGLPDKPPARPSSGVQASKTATMRQAAPFVCTKMPAYEGDSAISHLSVSNGGYRLVASVNPATLAQVQHESATLTYDGKPVAQGSVTTTFWSFAVLGPADHPVNYGACIAWSARTGWAGVVVWYMGGAHGPHAAQVLYQLPDGHGSHAEFTFPEASLENVEYVGGHPLFVGADPRMDYEWTSFACSGMPLRIQSFQDGRLVDVTGSYPALVRKDAAASWGQAGQCGTSPPQQDGGYSAWAEDECRLERPSQVWGELEKLAATGKLQSTVPPAEFISELKHQLVGEGICRAAPTPKA